MISTKFQAIIAAAIALSIGSVSAAPLSQGQKRDLGDLLDTLEARSFQELSARGPGKLATETVKKVVKDVVHGKATDAANDALNDRLRKQHELPQPFQDALAKATGPYNPILVHAAIHPKAPTQKRDLGDLLDTLDARRFEELSARGPGKLVTEIAKKVVKDVVHGKATDAANDALNDRLRKQHELPQPFQDALAKATGPHNPILVNAAIHPKAPNGKRDLGDLVDFLEARALILEELNELD